MWVHVVVAWLRNVWNVVAAHEGKYIDRPPLEVAIRLLPLKSVHSTPVADATIVSCK